MSAIESISDYLQRQIETAVQFAASDLHFEPYADSYRVRLRIDGILHETSQVPAGLRERLASRLKVLAGLDISEKRLPQDGRMSLVLRSGGVLELRVSSLPTISGEKIALRLLSPTLSLPLSGLGLEPEQLVLLQSVMAQDAGLMLVTGPTGSGKSATLYACLAALNQGELNICSVEDPVEIVLPGVNQVAINDKAGLGFALSLRALLRQDPDVIMLGEMRDALTADIAVRAAQTGHRVWSSLHCGSAHSALARLLNMGVALFNLASCLKLIVSQRLLRRLCPDCRRGRVPVLAVLRQLGWQGALPEDACCYEPVGCPACYGRGYLGRVGVFELLPLAESDWSRVQPVAGLVLPGGACPDLRRAGLLKALRGETSLAEAASLPQLASA
jgi:type IV pilus assembly protein PilB